MNASTTRTPSRRRAAIAASTFALVCGAILAGVIPAQATTIISTSPGSPYSSSASVTVSGTGTPGNYVSVTECNSTLGGLQGTHCNHTAPTSTAYKTVQIPASRNWSVSIVVRKSFANWNYQMNAANTGTTTCTGSTVCQIQASEYTTNPPMAGPVGTAAKTIAFK